MLFPLQQLYNWGLAVMVPIWRQVKAISNEKGAPRRLENSLSGLTTTPYPKDNLISVFDLVQRSVRVYKDRPALGTRAFLGTQKADPKKGQRFDPEVFGETNWVSYGKFGERLKAFGAGLKKLGMISQPAFTNFEDVADQKVACSLTIYENTCAEWQTAAHGCFSQSMVKLSAFVLLDVCGLIQAAKARAAVRIDTCL